MQRNKVSWFGKKKLLKFVEGRALRTKTTKNIRRFIFEDIFSRYKSIGRMRINRGELDVIEAEGFFKRYGVHMMLATLPWSLITQNPKNERMQGNLVAPPISPDTKQKNIWHNIKAIGSTANTPYNTNQTIRMKALGFWPHSQGWGFMALTKNHPSKISWMKWLQ